MVIGKTPTNLVSILTSSNSTKAKGAAISAGMDTNEPASDDETVIPLELVLGAVGRNVSTLDYHPVWGVDIARFGDDRTALAKRQKNKLLEPVKSWNSTDLMATAGKIKAEYDATPYDARPSEILVDIIGLGAWVYDRCRELGLPVRGVNVGEAAASRDNCARLRDELWFKGREWFQDRRAQCQRTTL